MTGIKLNINIHQSDTSKPFILSCDASWSVKTLKEAIQSAHASRPEVSCQTLIYKERCLGDTEILSSLLQMSDNAHNMQLSLSMQKQTAEAQSSGSSSDGLRHRHTQPNSINETNPWQHWQQYQNYPYFQQPSTPEQYAAMWQQYQQQVNNYMRYYNSQTADQQPISTQPTTSTDGAGPPAADPNTPAAPAAEAQAPPANIPDPPMNAQGGFAPADNDDGAPNDWLDIVFTLFRYSFFLSIIYFYSTFWRFLFVAGFFLVLYMYQTGLFRAQRRNARPDEVRQENAARPSDAEVIDDNNNQNDDDNVNTSAEEQPAPPPPSIFATAWCFISTFFTSLIPQPPPVV